MKCEDLPELIEMCNDALRELDQFETTGKSKDIFTKIRAIGSACTSGGQLDSFLKDHISIKEHYKIEEVVNKLRKISQLSGGRGKNIHVKNNINVVKQLLERIDKRFKDDSSSAKYVNIFYSWQATLPNKTNRGFIHNCIEKAIKEIRKEISIEARLDSDTSNVPGSPDIIHTILRKIEKSDIFVADVSIVNNLTPNPNVMIELGYALKALGDPKILMVFNAAFGLPQDLPFDLGFKRQIIYKLSQHDDKTKERQKMVVILKKAFEKIIENL